MVGDGESDDDNLDAKVTESPPVEVIGALVRLAKPSFRAEHLRRLADRYFGQSSEKPVPESEDDE